MQCKCEEHENSTLSSPLNKRKAVEPQPGERAPATLLSISTLKIFNLKKMAQEASIFLILQAVSRSAVVSIFNALCNYRVVCLEPKVLTLILLQILSYDDDVKIGASWTSDLISFLLTEMYGLL